jgi:hypothetical protein
VNEVKKQFERFLLSPAYPLFLSIYPILTLFTNNIYQLSFSFLLRPFLISVFVATLIFGGAKLFFRAWHKSAFFATLVVLFFGFYGHIKNLLDAKEVRGASLYILGGGLLIIFFFIFFDKKNKGEFDYASLAPSINLIVIILLLFPFISMTRHYTVKRIAFSSITPSFKELDNANLEALPDIYYIIPDAYARSDTLKEIYHYDNSEFIAELEKDNFYIAKCGQSNYPITLLSLVSSLNIDYIPNLNERFTPEEDDILYLFATLRKNIITEIFSTVGYEIIAFATGFPWTEMRNADIFISPPSGKMNEFEIIFLQTTIAQILDDTNLVDYENLKAERYRERTLLVFDSLPSIAKMPGPQFVFVHIILPHPPFGFDAEGNEINPAEVDFEEGYTNQVAYFNDEIIKSIETIKAESETPPIIIIQGDHGPPAGRPDWELRILNAYYLPEDSDSLYPGISPVNTFRLILNEYFGENYSLLPDKSYQLETDNNYDYTLVENFCEK